MIENEHISQQIDDFILGRMPKEEVEAFAEKVRLDELLKNEVNFRQQVIQNLEIIDRQALMSRFESYNNPTFFTKLKIYIFDYKYLIPSVTVIIACVITLAIMLTKSNNEKVTIKRKSMKITLTLNDTTALRFDSTFLNNSTDTLWLYIIYNNKDSIAFPMINNQVYFNDSFIIYPKRLLETSNKEMVKLVSNRLDKEVIKFKITNANPMKNIQDTLTEKKPLDQQKNKPSAPKQVKNLNVPIEFGKNSTYFNDGGADKKEFGLLYNWVAARKACPKGFHLPEINEWNQLINSKGGTNVPDDADDNTTYENLKKAGFDILFGGICNMDGGIMNKKCYGYNNISYYWSQSSVDEQHAYGYLFQKDNGRIKIKKTRIKKSDACSCMCFPDK